MVAGVQAVQRRSWRIAAAYAAGVAVLIGPWLVKNVIDTGNPVYPLAYGLFGGHDWDAALQAKWSAAHGPRPVTLDALDDRPARRRRPVGLAVAAVPGPGAAGAAAARGRGAPALALWAYAAYLFAHLVAADPPGRPLLDPDAAGRWRSWRASGPTGRADRAWTVLLAAVLTVGVASNLVLRLDRSAGSTRWTDDLDTLRDEVPAFVNPPLARLDDGAARRGQGPDGRPGGVFPCGTRSSTTRCSTARRSRRSPGARTGHPPRRGGDPPRIPPTGDHPRLRRLVRDRSAIASPGNYGYSDFVTPALFERLVADGVLEPMAQLGPQP